MFECQKKSTPFSECPNLVPLGHEAYSFYLYFYLYIELIPVLHLT